MRWLPNRQVAPDISHGAEESPLGDPVNGEQATSPIDIQKALDALGGDLELMRDVVRTFVETLPSLVAEMKAACASNDADRLRGAAHSLKGSSSNICAEPVRKTAERIELVAKQKANLEPDADLKELEAHIEQLKAFAAAWLNEAEGS